MKRRDFFFIIVDSPGHLEYTRNMVTGASNADLIIILIDAEHGVIEQTRRHSIIASLLDIHHVVVAINKMDLVGYEEEVFNTIVAGYGQAVRSLGFADVTYIPISALKGDNIIENSERMEWFNGPALLPFLENVEIENQVMDADSRLYVQYVIRPQSVAFRDYRGYTGRVAGNGFKAGDKVLVLPSGLPSTIKSIESGNGQIPEAFGQQSITIQLDDDINISRGDVIVKKEGHLPIVSQDMEALICWMDTKPLLPGNRYLLQLNSCTVPAVIKQINYRLDVNTITQEPLPAQAALNDIVHVTIKTAIPLIYDPYKTSHTNGGAILIDETTNLTVGAVILQ